MRSDARGGAGAVILVVLLVLALLVGGGLYVGDGYAERRVESETAVELQRQLGTPEPPQVDIVDEPFLTQIVGGRITSVHVVGQDLGTTNDAKLKIADADLVLTDVTSDDWFAMMRASHAEGSARMEYAAVEALAGLPLAYAPDGRVAATPSTTIFGQRVTAVITGRPAVDRSAQAITLADPTISVAGVDLPDFTAKALISALVKPIPVTGLPFGLRLDSVTAAEDGLHAGVTGDDLPISR